MKVLKTTFNLNPIRTEKGNMLGKNFDNLGEIFGLHSGISLQIYGSFFGSSSRQLFHHI
jgi:hypothetical protein